jgi:hypothetical protein
VGSISHSTSPSTSPAYHAVGVEQTLGRPARPAAQLGRQRRDQHGVAAPGREHLVEPQRVDRAGFGAQLAGEEGGERASALAAVRRGGEEGARHLVELPVEPDVVDRPPRRHDGEQGFRQ